MVQKQAVLRLLIVSNLLSVVLLAVLGVKNQLFYYLSIFGYIPFYVGTILYFKPAKKRELGVSSSESAKTLSCPKCRADNTTRCLIHTVWIRNTFNPNWHIWKCPQCETELTISRETKNSLRFAGVFLVIVLIYFFVNQFVLGALLMLFSFVVVPSIMLGYSGKLVEVTDEKERWW